MYQKRKVASFLLVEALICLMIMTGTVTFFYDLSIQQLKTKQQLENDLIVEQLLKRKAMFPSQRQEQEIDGDKVVAHYESQGKQMTVWAELKGKRYEYQLQK